MAKKFIDVMDTTFRDGFQSIFGGRVLLKDFIDGVNVAKDAGIKHFEFGGGARFQTLYFYLNEDAFQMMDTFRERVGPDINLQTLSRGISTVTLDISSREIIDLYVKLFKKHGTTTIRNFDALNDINNLKFTGEIIKKHSLKHELCITMIDLPHGCEGAHDLKYYERVLREILDSGIPYDSLCFKDSTGTANPNKIYETIKLARKLFPKNIHFRLHTHESGGISVACYLAALEAGVDGIDLAAFPVSGGTSQPDILVLLHAVKGKNYNLGDLDTFKILKYEDYLEEKLKDYFFPPESFRVFPIISFSPMPGGALTANTQLMRDNKMFDRYPEVIRAMGEVVEKGGFGASVTPVSQFYFQQAFNNVFFGKWKKIAPGYGKTALGYFGKTPVAPNKDIIKLASAQLKLDPTDKNPLDIADSNPLNKINHFRGVLEKEGIKATDENIFILASCKEKGLEFLKGNGKVNIRKATDKPKDKARPEVKQPAITNKEPRKYTITVNSKRYAVEINRSDESSITVEHPKNISAKLKSLNKNTKEVKPPNIDSNINGNTIEVKSSVSGSVVEIRVKKGQIVKKNQAILVVEAMKMGIEIVSPINGVVSEIKFSVGDLVEDSNVIALIKAK